MQLVRHFPSFFNFNGNEIQMYHPSFLDELYNSSNISAQDYQKFMDDWENFREVVVVQFGYGSLQDFYNTSTVHYGSLLDVEDLYIPAKDFPPGDCVFFEWPMINGLNHLDVMTALPYEWHINNPNSPEGMYYNNPNRTKTLGNKYGCVYFDI